MRIACLMPDDAVYASACRKLAPYGFECIRHTDDASLLRVIHRSPIDVVLCDVGFDSAMENRLLLWLESSHVSPLSIVLQMPEPRAERVAHALSAGVDDVVMRSADALEVVARLRASIRRRGRQGGVTSIQVAGYRLDQTTGGVFNNGAPIDLTAREFALAWLLFSRAGTCLSRKTISIVVWGLNEDLSSRSMEQHIHSLRRKLDLHDGRGVAIRAIYGKGYQLMISTPTTADMSRLAALASISSIERVQSASRSTVVQLPATARPHEASPPTRTVAPSTLSPWA